MTNGHTHEDLTDFDRPTLKTVAGQYANGTRYHMIVSWTSSGTTPDSFLFGMLGERDIDTLTDAQRAALLLLVNRLLLASHEPRPLLAS